MMVFSQYCNRNAPCTHVIKSMTSANFSLAFAQAIAQQRKQTYFTLQKQVGKLLSSLTVLSLSVWNLRVQKLHIQKPP